MDLSRAVYSRDLKIATMRALDSGSSTGEIARKYQLSPKLLERWRGEWRAKGESVEDAQSIDIGGVQLSTMQPKAPWAVERGVVDYHGRPATLETKYTSVNESCTTDSGLRKPETDVLGIDAFGIGNLGSSCRKRRRKSKATAARRKTVRLFMRNSPFS